jgi:mxaJ protein
LGGASGTALRKILLLTAATLLGSCSPRLLTACADPNNLPFSNRAGEGFENKLARMIAADLGMRLQTVWWAQRRGYARNTLNEQKCDFWPGVASGLETMATSRPYYRSTYVFVTRKQDRLHGLTLDDPRLRDLKVGVHMVGDDGSNTPPAHALASRGMIRNVKGYMLYGDYRRPNPPAEIVTAVERGDVNVALVWGPVAGYFAAQSPVPLRTEPVTPWFADAQWPMQFDVSIGVSKENQKLLKQIDRILARRRLEIRKLLGEYHVPLIEL